MGVDADGDWEGNECHDHESEEEEHEEGGGVEVEHGDFPRAADDERDEGADHGYGVYPGRGVELPTRSREEGSA